jgi:hypothetical protein
MAVVMTLSAVNAPLGWAAAAPAPRSIGQRVTSGIASGVSKVNAYCAALLTDYVPGYLHKPLKVAGHVVPIIPIFKTLAEADNLFYVFIESPLIGLVTTPLSGLTAELLAGHQIIFDKKFLQKNKEVYLSYQEANAIRNGVSIQRDIPENLRVWLNWWYSTAVYAWQTAGQKLAEAHTPQQKVYALSLVGYAALWPLFSQRVSQYVLTPILFSKFPKRSLLNELNSPAIKMSELTAPREAKVAELEGKIKKMTDDLAGLEGTVNPDDYKALNKDYKKAKTALGILKAELKWIRWFRKSAPDGVKVAKLRNLEYWGIKTSASMTAAIMMVTIYFLVRWALVGEQPDDSKLIQRIFGIFFSQGDPKGTISKEDLEKIPAVVRHNVEAIRQNPGLLTEAGTPDAFPKLAPADGGTLDSDD